MKNASSKKVVRFVFLASLLSCFLTAAFAAGVGTAGGQFLKMDVGARGIAMGSAQTALVNGAEAVYWNPAVLGLLDKKSVTASYNSYIQNVVHGFTAYAHPTSKGTFGAGVTFSQVPGIERRSTDVETAEAILTASDMAVSLSYGRANVFKEIALGGSLKYISSNLIDASASTPAIDLGAYRKFSHGLSGALVLRNVIGSLRFDKISDPLPFRAKVGVGYQRELMDRPLVAGLDFDIGLNESKNYYGLGVEYQIIGPLTARAGYQMGNDAAVGFAGGIGLDLAGIGVDLALMPFGPLGNSFRITLGYQF